MVRSSTSSTCGPYVTPIQTTDRVNMGPRTRPRWWIRVRGRQEDITRHVRTSGFWTLVRDRRFRNHRAMVMATTLVVVAVWLRSMWSHDVVRANLDGQSLSLRSLNGRLVLVVRDQSERPQSCPCIGSSKMFINFYVDPDQGAYHLYGSLWNTLGFGSSSQMGQFIIYVPYWCVTLLWIWGVLIYYKPSKQTMDRAFPI